jgi:hypothetical protein
MRFRAARAPPLVTLPNDYLVHASLNAVNESSKNSHRPIDELPTTVPTATSRSDQQPELLH